MSKKDLRILEKFDIRNEKPDLNSTSGFANLKEILRLERSRRAALGIGISLSVLSAVPIAGGLALNLENGKWINDPMGNGMLIAAIVPTAISIPFYLISRKMKNRRDQTLDKLR